MDLEIDKVDKLKVVELRTALGEAGLDTKGTKPILVARLKSYLESKNGEDAAAEEAEAEKEPEAEVKEEAKPAEEAKPVEIPKAEEPAAAAEAMETAEPEKPKEEPTTPAKEETKTDKAATTPAAADNKDKRGTKRKREDEPYVVNEDEPEIPQDFICLDWFNSDLTMKINKENFSAAEPFHVAAWGYIFSSARATHGFTSGKIAFEVKWTKNMEVKLDDVKEPHELRVGWSSDDCNLQLGESAKSYCVNNLAKKAHNMEFEDFEGCNYTTGDVITCSADFDSDNVTIAYAKNGEDFGETFSFAKSSLEGKPLFPHVSSRNVKFEINFGADKEGKARENWFEKPEGFSMAAEQVATAQRGMARIGKREDCEMIMLMGLPGCGKTTWTEKHVSENIEKRYNVIGTTRLEDRMNVNGESKRKLMGDKWDTMVPKLTKCVHSMLNIACQRRRNFIIDQTNVFANAQKRKVRPFEGMTRKAIVIVPSEEDYKARIEAQEKAQCKDVPDNAVMEMKANFTLPEESKEDNVSMFKEIIFTDLQREEATKLVAEYNKDAKDKGFGKKQENLNKRRRGNFNNRGGGQGMMRGRGGPFRGRGGPGMMPRGGPRGMFPGRGFPPRGMMRPPMRGGPMGPPRGGPRGMPFMGSNRGGPGGNRGMMNNRGGPMGGNGGNRGGPGGNRGGNRGGNFNRGGNQGHHGGNRGGNQGGPMGGNRGGYNQQQKFGGGPPAPWGNPNPNPSPWQQNPQRSNPMQNQGQWGNMWNQGQNNAGGGNPWGGQQNQRMGPMGGGPGGNQGFNNFGGGNQNYGNNGGGYGGNNQGYPGSQNWGGFR